MVKIILFTLFIGCCVAVLSSVNEQNLMNLIGEFGEFGWVIYVGCWVVLPVFLFPAGVLALGGGVIFGFWEALGGTMIGVGINSAIMYFIAYYFSSGFNKDKFEQIRTKFCKDEFALVLLLRLIPLVPYNAVNYMAGAFRFNFVKFMVAGVVGKLISAVLFINLGSNLANWREFEFWVALALVLGMGIGAFWVRKILNRRYGEDSTSYK